MKIFYCLLISMALFACSNPFQLNNLSDNELKVIDKVSQSDFSPDSLNDRENSYLISASRKYIADSQPEYAENLINCVNRKAMLADENIISYHYLKALIFSGKSNPGGALKEAGFAANRCRKIISSASHSKSVKEDAEYLLADIYSFSTVLYRSIGRIDKAFEFIAKSVRIYEKSDNPNLQKNLVRNYISAVDLYTLNRRYDRAAAYIDKTEIYFNSAENKKKIEDEDEKTFRQVYINYLLSKLSFFIRSESSQSLDNIFSEAENLADEDNRYKSLSRIWLLRADLAGKKNNRELEFECLIKAVEYARETEDRLLRGVSAHRLAFYIDSLSDDGIYDGEESIGYLKSALDDFSFIADTFNVRAEYSHYAAILSKSYERYIDHLVLKEEYEEALFYSEKIRSRRLRNRMASKEINPDSLIDAKYKKEIISLGKTRDYLVRSYMKLSSDYYADKQELKRLLAKIEYMNSLIREKRAEAEILSPGYRIARVNPVRLSGARELLREKQALIVYHPKDNMTVYRWIITKDDFSFKKIFLNASLSGMVDEMRKNIGWGSFGYYYTPRAHEAGHFLYNALIKDIVDKGNLSKHHLIIVPPHTMELIPFDALVTGFDKSKRPEYLLDRDYILSLTPSLTVFAMKRQKEKNDFRYDFVGFADPFYGSHARQLYQSIRETKRISSFFSKKKVYTGRRAKESLFKRAKLSDFRYVHVSTHGNFLAKTLKEPVILFSLEGDPGQDGYLLSSEVYKMRINSQLLSFSACNTALGKRDKYEGVKGFTHAFFTAGVREVLLTLWPVEANSAEMFFVEFYRNCSKGDEPAVAINKARKYVKKRYPSPYHWAPVVHQF